MRRVSAILGVFALSTCAATLGGNPTPASAVVSGSITGAVFIDTDVDGVADAGESGAAGVEVKAYDTAGTVVGTATTAANGTYSMSVTASATEFVRIEFGAVPGYQPSFGGSGNMTSIQFVTVPATSVNYAVHRPGDYCANNSADPDLVSACQRPGIATNNHANNPVGTAPTLAGTTWSGRQTPQGILRNSQTGAVWGIATQANTGLVWTSAVLRRHSGLGPLGLGGLYVAHPATGLLTSFDLATHMTLSGDNSQFTDANRGFRTDTHMSVDTPGFANVGKVGIGDIDFSPDGTKLYVMNLYERKIYVFPVGGPPELPTLGSPSAITVTDPGCANSADIRPWGLKVTDTDVYAGVVCSNETASAAAFTAAAPAAVNTRPTGAYIRKYALSSSTWSTVKDINLGYSRGHEVGCDTASNATATGINGRFCETARWHAWTDNYAAIKAAIANFRISGDPAGIGMSSVLRFFPEPIFVGIEILADGSIIAGFADRFAMQMGWENVSPTGTMSSSTPYTSSEELVEGRAVGDTLLVCNNGGTYTVESNGSCGSRTAATYPNARLNSVNTYREFFDDNLGSSSSDHVELSQGAVAVWPLTGTQRIAMTAYDPGYDIFEGGVRWLNASDGGQHVSNGTYYATWYSGMAPNSENQYDDQKTSFGKSAGMADLELLCDQAPVQIGNRVWIDSDSDGVQDPGESPVAGATVRLYNSAGTTLLGTAITDAKGEYYFSSNVTEGAGGNGDNSGGGVVIGAGHLIRMDKPSDFAAGGPLQGYALTTPNANAANTSLDTSVDSNATTVSAYPQVTVAVVLPGVNNHTYDIGFYLPAVPKVSVGNLVWIDTNSNGTQDAGEPGLAGAVLTLTTSSGQPVTDVNGNAVTPQTTTSTGAYLFSNLPVGQYKVSITYPAGYTATTTGRGTVSTDSSTDFATSVNLPADGDADLTLDFGVVTAVSGGGGTSGGNSNPNSVTTTTTPAGGKQTGTTVPGSGNSQGTSRGSSVASNFPGTFSGGSGRGSGADGSAVWVGSTLSPSAQGVSVGGYVWFDSSRNGRQGTNENGARSVMITITDMNGSPVRDRFGKVVRPTTTDASGHYLFTDLKPGRYATHITYPRGYTATTSSMGSSLGDSDAHSSRSILLDRNGDFDVSLDFGLVPSGTLPVTGSSNLPLIVLGATFVILGLATRRRRQA